MKKLTLLFTIIFIAGSLFGQDDRGFKPVQEVTEQKGNRIENNYYALIIGNNSYKDEAISSLDEPINDARKLYNVLTNQYTFASQNVSLLTNATYVQMIDAFDNLSNKLTEDDNLLVFYAGHGWWDKDKNLGYWLPTDARKNSTAFWIRNSTISDYMSSIKSKHTLLIADACFSGSIFKTRIAFDDAGREIKSLYKLPSKTAMTSGNLKEVPDKSKFLEYLVKRLKNNTEKYLPADQLFVSFRKAVMNNSTTEPQFGTIQDAGDEGGEFIFIKRTGTQQNQNNNKRVDPEEGGLVHGNVVYKYGTINIDTEIGGKLYIDGKYKGDLQANTTGNKLSKQLTGSHTYKIIGINETKTGTITVYKNQTANIEIKSTKNPEGTFVLNADFTVPAAGMSIKMRGIQGGSFTMGSSDSEARSNETPHTVKVSNFAMMKYEVTIEEYMKFANATNGNNPEWLESGSTYNIKTGTHDYYKKFVDDYSKPIVGVSWNNAVAYAKWLSQKTGQTWRLPTEAEWEYAAKGGQNYKYAGSSNISKVGYYSENSGRNTHPVGQKSPNGYNLYDMTGNVWEWCSDWYAKDYYKNSPTNNPKGASNGSSRVLRGGGWLSYAKNCRLAFRDRWDAVSSSSRVGFRLVFVP